MDRHRKQAEQEELGSLAYDSEKLRFKVSPDDKLPPASTSQTGSHAVSASQPGAFGVVAWQESQRRYKVSPAGLAFIGFLFVLVLFGNSLQLLRTSVLYSIATSAGTVVPKEQIALIGEDYANTMEKTGSGDAVKYYQSLADSYASLYGKSDQRTVWANMKIAAVHLKRGNEPASRAIWSRQLQYLNEPSSTVPPSITATLVQLARSYDRERNDPEPARLLYLAALRFWPVAPGGDTISNVEADLAQIDENSGRFAEANEYFQKALDYGKRFGIHAFTVYRLLHIGKTYSEMGMLQQAVDYLQKAKATAHSIGYEGEVYVDEIETALGKAQEGLRNGVKQ